MTLLCILNHQFVDSESSFLNHQIEDSAVQLVGQKGASKRATDKTCGAMPSVLIQQELCFVLQKHNSIWSYACGRIASFDERRFVIIVQNKLTPSIPGKTHPVVRSNPSSGWKGAGLVGLVGLVGWWVGRVVGPCLVDRAGGHRTVRKNPPKLHV